MAQTPWAHVDVGTGPQYPGPRFSNMVPTTHVTRSDRFDGRLPVRSPPQDSGKGLGCVVPPTTTAECCCGQVGGNATSPEYHDDEFKVSCVHDDPG